MDFDDICFAQNEAKKHAWLHHMTSTIGTDILKLASNTAMASHVPQPVLLVVPSTIAFAFTSIKMKEWRHIG